MHSSTILTTLALAYPAFAQYSLKWNYDSSNFFNNFNFVNSPDTFTNGFATYVSQDEATSSGLATTTDGKVRLGVDSNSTYSASLASGGRKSIRLISKQSFDNGLLVADIPHLPVAGCGMWPAFWVYTGETAGNYGEIDIVENVNAANQNSHSFYTAQQCTMNIVKGDATRGGNCHHDPSGPQPDGCSFIESTGTFGNSWNENGYQVIALQKEVDMIKIWQFKSSEVPVDIGTGNPNPNNWPSPTVEMTPQSCDLGVAFTKLFVTINTAFCGEWAGTAESWSEVDDKTSCKTRTNTPTCNAWVANNPDDFKDTYWEINSVKLFQK